MTRVQLHTHNPICSIVISGCQHLVDAFNKHNLHIQIQLSIEEAEAQIKEISKYQIIIVGVNLYPIRRRMVTEFRKVNPNAAFIFLKYPPTITKNIVKIPSDTLIADFMLSSACKEEVWRAALSLCSLFPFPACKHMQHPLEAPMIEKVMRIISANFADPTLDLENVAKKLNIPAYQLSVLLNQQVGIRFRQLLQQTRMEAAKQMLSSGNMNIKEIAQKVGFTDSDYFSRVFKNYTGSCATAFKGQLSSE